MTTPKGLGEVLDRVSAAANGSEVDGSAPAAPPESVSVADILHRIGEDSFAPVILVPALLLVSPLSGIPGTPTIGALIIVTITVQWLWGRDHLWLPRFLRSRQVDAERLVQAVATLRRPAAWIDRHSRDRLRLLVVGPAALIAKLCVLCIALTWPVLELFPFVTSLGASAVALFAFGLMMRDGVYVLAGCAMLSAMAGGVFWLSQAV